MKLLLTSGGIRNESIRGALVELLGKPIEECSALFIPTALWGHPMCDPGSVVRSIQATADEGGLCQLGWRSVGVLELTALPSIPVERWRPWVQGADVLLVDGGEAVYLARWIRESGLAELIPTLVDTVWVGISAGSMALTPRIGREFVELDPSGGDETLGLVPFSIFPHLDYPGWDDNTLERAREWATRIPGESYAMDDQTALVVVDGAVQVVSEGHWEAFRTEVAVDRPARDNDA